MSLDTIVNIILSIFSFLLAVISVVTVVLTLKQNNKLLEANSRPYVVVYFVYEEYSTNYYFCVQNFGNASAIIQSISLEPDIRIFKKSCSEMMRNTMIAPRQQMHFVLSFSEKDRILKDSDFSHSVKVEYLDCVTNKVYTEEYSVDLQYSEEVLSTRNTHSNYTHTENMLNNIEKSIMFIKNRTL